MQYNPNPIPNSALTSDEKTWAMLCHLAALAGYIGIPYANILGPLVVWLIKKDQSAYVDMHGKESLNFHISMAIYLTAAVIGCFFCIGFFALIPLAIMGLVCTIIGAVKASNGEHYAYPLTIRFLN